MPRFLPIFALIVGGVLPFTFTQASQAVYPIPNNAPDVPDSASAVARAFRPPPGCICIDTDDVYVEELTLLLFLSNKVQFCFVFINTDRARSSIADAPATYVPQLVIVIAAAIPMYVFLMFVCLSNFF